MRLTPKVIAYISLLVYWGPSNLLCYLWGFFLFIFICAFKTEWLNIKGIFSKKIVIYVGLFLCIFLLSFFLNYYAHGSSLNNLFWSIFTYGSSLLTLLSLLMIPFKQEDIKKIFMFSVYLALFQVLLGYFQMLYVQSFTSINPFAGGKDAGDFFVGTTFNPGIGSLVAMKISLTALLFFPFWIGNKSIKNSLILLFLFIGWVLASALFTLIIGVFVIFLFFVVNKLIRSFFTYKLHKSIYYIIVLGLIGVTFFVFTQKNNVTYILTSVRYAYATVMGIPTHGKVAVRKITYYKKTLVDLPKEYPSMLLIGVGPGNYSSRSAWMISGEYLKNQPAYIPVTPSDIARKYSLAIWSKKMITTKFKGAGSIMHQPFSTWVSIFAEMGIAALITFYLIFRTFYKGFKTAMKTTQDLFISNFALGLKMSTVYIALLFFMENIFEYPLIMGQFFIFACAAINIVDNSPRADDANTLHHG